MNPSFSICNTFAFYFQIFRNMKKNKLLQIKRRFSRIDLFFEEGVCRWHMTDEKRDLDRKDSLR